MHYFIIGSNCSAQPEALARGMFMVIFRGSDEQIHYYSCYNSCFAHNNIIDIILMYFAHFFFVIAVFLDNSQALNIRIVSVLGKIRMEK